VTALGLTDQTPIEWTPQDVDVLRAALVAAEAREKQLREALTEAVESLAMWEGGSLPPSNTLKRARAALAAGGENPADNKERT
jgi:hypothetical protein